MQMICEVYHLMRQGLGMTHKQMHAVFAEWNKGELNSYLIEITRDILGYTDENGQKLWISSWTLPGRKAPANGQSWPRSTQVNR
jgi:6-phosphogluconate dehydrogenase